MSHHHSCRDARATDRSQCLVCGGLRYYCTICRTEWIAHDIDRCPAT